MTPNIGRIWQECSYCGKVRHITVQGSDLNPVENS